MPEQNDTAVALLQSDMNYLKGDITEIKNSQKEFNKKIDDLALKFQEFGGLSQMIADVSQRVMKLEQYKWLMAGAIALGAFIATMIVNYFKR